MKKLIKLACLIMAFSFIFEGCSHEIKTMSPEEVKKAESSHTGSEIEKTTEKHSDLLIFGDKTTDKSKKEDKKDKTKKEKEDDTEKTTEAKTEKDNGEYPAPEVKNIQGLTYKQGILIVNKTYSIPSTYNPGVDPTAQSAFNKMSAAAQRDGISLYIVSGFRSYSTQQSIYNNYVAQDGVAGADRYSARAGHSEHQTGLAFDVNSLSQSFENTAEGKWLAANCYKYGFIIRFPKGKESITGYMYEPWHVRYLGSSAAKAVYESGLTLEEYLGVNSVYAQ